MAPSNGKVVDEAAEAARKEKQRQHQREALEARAAGADFKKLKRSRKPLERRKFEKRSKESNRERRVKQKAAKQQKAKSAQAGPEVVVVPIFWKGVAEQRGRVLSACKDIEQLLLRSGRRVELDGGTKYTPGQKFAHWEHRGVKLRVEVGPREAERGCCTLARTFKPGVAAKRLEGITLDDEALLLRRLAELDAMKDESQVAALQAEEEHAFESDADDADSGLGGRHGASAKLSRKAAASARASGDDLEDDFAPVLSGKADDGAGDRADDDADDAAVDADASGDGKPLNSSSKRKRATAQKGEKQPDASRKARKSPKVVKF